MTNMKRLALMLLAAVMLLAMTAPAMAEESKTYTLTLKNALAGHTYTAYQIFAGDLFEGEAAEGDEVLSNIVWGAGVTEAGKAALGDAAVRAAALEYARNAAAFAEEVAGYLGEAAGSAAVAEGADSCAIEGLEAGYYLVRTTKVPVQEDGSAVPDTSYTNYIMVVVENIEVSIKSSVPRVEKKVDDVNDSNTSENATVWQDSADYDIGDGVPYKLTAVLADNVESYETYSISFVDTLSGGLTYAPASETGKVVVYLVSSDDNGEVYYTPVTGYFTVDYANDVLTIACDDVKEFGAGNSSVIEVHYTAVLNENAVVGAAGNPNTVYLEYSNNPYGEETGRTTEDKVTVFTYKVIVNKTDADDAALAGAGFTLYKKNAAGEYAKVGEELKAAEGEEMTTFEWSGLDAGDYMLEESTTPAGYNTIEAVRFTIEAAHDADSDEPKLTALTGTVADAEAAEGEEAKEVFTTALDVGSLTTKVINTTGATLPSTGGMGTTVIYIAGGALVLVAVIILIAKKRAGSDK